MKKKLQFIASDVENWGQWLDTIMEATNANYMKHARKRFRRDGNLYDDDLGWLEPDTVEVVSNHFIKDYDTLKGYHACRPLNIGKILATGLWVSGPKLWWEMLKERLGDQIHEKLAEIEEIIRKTSVTKNELWFSGEIEQCIEPTASHYLIRGGEQAGCLFHEVTDKLGIKPKEQANKGIPTIFECNVNSEWLPKHEVKQLIAEMITEYCVGHIEEYRPNFRTCFRSTRDLPPEAIVTHWHPKWVTEPHDRQRIVKFNVTCDQCNNKQGRGDDIERAEGIMSLKRTEFNYLINEPVTRRQIELIEAELAPGRGWLLKPKATIQKAKRLLQM